jgi:histidyl-tRNA synthetase
MTKAIRAIRGFRDVPPEEAWKLRYIEDRTQEHFQRYGYREIRLPVVEFTELFARGIGEATDIVEKEMYTFLDRNGQSLTLRPEGTASAVRAYIEGGWKSQRGIAKVYYSGPMFRYERPQKGRYRQFYQLGLEAIGGEGPLVDAEVIDLLHRLFLVMELDDVQILVNSLGCEKCRPAFRVKLLEYLSGVAHDLCSNCIRRMETNPLRVLDCKVPDCRSALEKAPVMLDYLCAECEDHFSTVREALDGLDVTYNVDPMIVRGLDYYNRTAFEAVCDRLGSQNAVAAGGRYDGLAKEIGGEAPGVGFAMGLERLSLIMNWDDIIQESPDYYVAAATSSARIPALELGDRLRELGLAVEVDLEDRSLKAQLRSANRMDIDSVLIIGDDELSRGAVTLKDFANKSQREVPLEEFMKEAMSTGIGPERR